jgi:hypothetical protein
MWSAVQKQNEPQEARHSAVAPARGRTSGLIGRERSLLRVQSAAGNHAVQRVMQRKLAVNRPGDRYEQKADRIAGQVMAMVAPCAACRGPVQVQRLAGGVSSEAAIAPASVDRELSSLGSPLEPALRQDMEQRFGADFGDVRTHSGPAAAQSAQDVNAHAYTVGRDIVFDQGAFAPHTGEGRRLIAHELAHVVQQSAAPTSGVSRSPVAQGVVQRAPAKGTLADYEKLVKQGKWCRDSKKSGQLHDPDVQCYREIPAKKGYPSANQECFDKKTGKWKESSPDCVSAVSGQKKDGTCDIPLELTDPPQPFTQRGRRALGHAICDIATEDAGLFGLHFGRLTGVAMGIALPHGLDSRLASAAIPLVMGYLAGELSSRGLPVLNRFGRKYGFLPTVSGGIGVGSNLSLGLGVGLEKRDHPLPLVPINTYLTLGFDTTLEDKLGGSASFLAKVGVRVDPGKQGGFFALGAVGGGLKLGHDVSGVTSTELGVGLRATDFLDVQVVRETEQGENTYWLTLKLVAPRAAYKFH